MKKRIVKKVTALFLCVVTVSTSVTLLPEMAYAQSSEMTSMTLDMMSMATVKNLVKNTTENKAVIALDKKKTLKLPLLVKAANLKFSSGKKSVATVNSKGLVKAKKTGTVKITVKGKAGSVKGAKQVITVYVAKKSVKSVRLNVTTKELAPGDSFQLKTTVSPSNAANVVVYTSNKSNVAKVSSAGKVTAVAPGTAKITATTVDGKKKAVCTITVKKAANTESATSNNGTANPATADPGATNHGTANTATAAPEVAKTETANPATTAPGAPKPETANPATTNPGTTAPEQTAASTEIVTNLTDPTVENGIVSYSCVYFGNYPQSDGTGVVKEPIKWRVLSVNGTDAFLLADSLLDTKQYNVSNSNVTWKTCTIRSWLNGYGSDSNSSGIDYSNDNFIDTAFTADEQKAIKTTQVVNEANPSSGTSGGENTTDKVYLPSINELLNTNYGFTSEYGVFTAAGDVARRRYTTEYVNAQKHLEGVNLVAGKKDLWWLRSLGANASTAAYVYDWGSIEKTGAHVDTAFPVCPVLHLDLTKTESWKDAGKITINTAGTITVIE